jgi:uncharacterized Ntn-hydrolase superfamily protein
MKCLRASWRSGGWDDVAALSAPPRRLAPVRRWLGAACVAGCALAALPAPASATWSILAVDARTGRVVIASATCVAQMSIERFPATSLKDIQAIVVPGIGVAATQAALDRSRGDQELIYRELKSGTEPERILRLLRLMDPNLDARQIAILDTKGRVATYTGEGTGRIAFAHSGRVPGTDIYYSVQGNILASGAVVESAVRALVDEPGTIEDRVMAAMEAADAAGGDRRCSCRTEPLPLAPCRARHALVAYLLAADADDPEGSFVNNGRYRIYLDVNEQNIRPDEDANPVVTLRRRYDALVDRGASTS